MAAELPGKQRKYLRGLAHDLKAVVQVGDKGVTDSVVEAIEAALLSHELIKVRLHEPEDKKGMANQIVTRTGAALCGLIGHTVILYKEHPEEPVIHLPKR